MQSNKKIEFGVISLVIVLLIIVFADTLAHLSKNDKKLNDAANSQTISALASWWLAKAYFSGSEPPDIVILGSSQLSPLIGTDAYVYDRAIDITDDHRSYVLEHDFHALLNKDWRVFIAALPEAMISDQFFISRALFSNGYKPKLVAITFSPRDFIDKCSPSANATEPFAFFSKYTDPKILCNDLDKIRTDKYKTDKSGSDQVYNNPENRSEDESALCLGKPFQRIASGDIIIYSGNDQSFKTNLEEYKRRYENSMSSQLDTQLNYFDSLLKYLAQQNIQVIAFNLPLAPDNKKLLSIDFWKYYNARTSEVCRKNGADFVSLDQVVTEFQKDEFIDDIHLNLKGGHRLSKTIALFTANKFGLKTFQELLAKDNCLL